MNKSINFTDQEANATIALLDLAIKTGGLEVAETAVIIVNKIKNAFKPEEPKQEVPQEAKEQIKKKI